MSFGDGFLRMQEKDLWATVMKEFNYVWMKCIVSGQKQIPLK